jgi:nardilysin
MSDLNLNAHKPHEDHKVYAYCILENQLRVLLISDTHPNAHQRKAAASLSVGVGSSNDPTHVHGLAHFLEHMMSMGCQAYPNENDYASYLDSHGGGDNAWTDFETTLYHQEVEQEFLGESLKRMASVFSAPLLLKESFQREMNAVDSEFKQSLESDADRLQELWAFTSKQGHPFKRFTWGNLQSLRDDPAEHGVDVQEALKQFYESYYSANLMCLCVVSAATLSDMETMVRTHFASVPNRKLPRPTCSSAGPPWSFGAGLGQVYQIIPVKDHAHEIHMTFPTPPTCVESNHCSSEYALPFSQKTDGYRKRLDEIVGHIIGYEGKGSLLSWLKKKRLATALTAGCGDEPGGMERSSCCSLFSIGIVLTKQGVSEWETVVMAVMRCIRLIQTAAKDAAENNGEQRLRMLFEELKAIGNACWNFQSEADPCDLSEAYAELMQHRGVIDHPNDLLYAGHSTLSNSCVWDQKQFQAYVSYFVPKNCRIDIFSSSFKKEKTIDNVQASGDFPSKWLTEPRFGTQYMYSNFDEKMLINMYGDVKNAWDVETKQTSNEANEATCKNMMDEITLPSPNPFVPHQFDLRTPRSNTETQDHDHGHEEEQPQEQKHTTSVAVAGAVDTSNIRTAIATTVVVVDRPALRVWFLPDTQFHLPHLDVRFELDTPIFRSSPLHVVLTDVFVRLIRAEINEYAYDADCAALHVRVSESEGRLIFSFSGFNHKMSDLAKKVGERVASLIHDRQYSQENLLNVLESLRRQYSNQLLDPTDAARFWRLTVLQTDPIYLFDLDVTKQGVRLLDGKVTRTTLDKFLSMISEEADLTIHGLVHGNAHAEEAIELVDMFVQYMPVSGSSSTSHMLKRCSHLRSCKLPSDRSVRLSMPTVNPNERNSAIEIYFQGTGRASLFPWFHELSVVRILANLLDEPTFDRLRTKEQLGYTVRCDHRSTCGVVGFYFSVISASYTTLFIEERCEHFCNCALKYLKEMSTQEYVRRRTGLFHSLSEPHTDLEESADEMWSGVVCECSDGVDKRVANSVLTVEQEEVIKWWSTHVVAKSGRKKLVVCVDASNDDGEDEKEKDDEEEDEDYVEDSSENSESDDEDEEEEEEDCLEFPMCGELDVDWWKASYAVVELEPKDVGSFKATLELASSEGRFC